MEQSIRRAIAKVEVLQADTPVSRGTGTLVSDGLVLTAFHVVADRSTAALRAGRIRLTFPTHTTEARLYRDCFDPVADWALLECLDPPREIAPLPVAIVVASGQRFETFGFPDAQPVDGMVQRGTIENHDAALGGVPAIQLYSKQAAAGEGAPVQGASGSPLIVDDTVVGVIRYALMNQQRATRAGTLYACPLAPVIDRCRDRLLVKSPVRRRARASWALPVMSAAAATALVLAAVILRPGSRSSTSDVDCSTAFQDAIEAYARAADYERLDLGQRFQVAADCGDPLATMWVARGHHLGRMGLVRDEEQAARLAGGVLDVAADRAEQGDAYAQFLLGTAYRDGFMVDPSPSEARRWLGLAADAGDALARSSLGMMLLDGDGVAPNEAEGVERLVAAADQGVSNAAMKLAQWHLAADRRTDAFGWYDKAARLDHAEAMVQVGLMLEGAQGTEKNECEACVWFEKAAHAGVPAGQVNVALCYERGVECYDGNGARVFSRDPCHAKDWFEKAAVEGLPHGLYNLARVILSGSCEVPTDADIRQAREYLQIAATAGFAPARTVLDRLAAGGGP